MRLQLTPVMTAEDPLDTSSREKSVRKKDLMMKTRGGAAAPSRLRREDVVGAAVAESGARCMWRRRVTGAAEERPRKTLEAPRCRGRFYKADPTVTPSTPRHRHHPVLPNHHHPPQKKEKRGKETDCDSFTAAPPHKYAKVSSE